jgi:predicted esterase
MATFTVWTAIRVACASGSTHDDPITYLIPNYMLSADRTGILLQLVILCFTILSGGKLTAQAFETQKFRSHTGPEIPYGILFPENYDPTLRYPMVFFIHGKEAGGADKEAPLADGASLFLDSEIRERFPALVVVPQCPPEDSWVRVDSSGEKWSFPLLESPTPASAAALELLHHLKATEAVDGDRIYLVGISRGGSGIIEWLARRPDLFAAAVPIGGGGNTALTPSYGPQVPLWFFQGAMDDTVPVDLTRELARKLEAEGAKVRYTELPGAGHNLQDAALAEPQLLPWLFRQRKRNSFRIDLQPVQSATYTYATIRRSELALDLYRAAGEEARQNTTILYVHGGGFAGGRRDEPIHVEFARALAARGYTVANISYRLTMKGKSFSCDQPTKNKLQTFRAAANDIRRATLFLLQNADSLGIDPDRILLAGSSAGAEAILHAAYWEAQSAPGRWVGLPEGFRYAGLISMAGAMVDTSLIQTDNALPTMFFHGTCDGLVPYATAPHHYCSPDEVGYLPLHGAYTIAKRLDDLGVSRYLLTACGGGHEWASLPLYGDYTEDIDQFIRQTVDKGLYAQFHRTLYQDRICPEKPRPGMHCPSSP